MDNDLNQNFLDDHGVEHDDNTHHHDLHDDDDDDLDGRHRAVTLDTIDEEDEDENSDVVEVVGEAVGGAAGGKKGGDSAKPSAGTASLVASTFQLANCAIGAGVLAFPYAFANCGLAFGALLLVFLTVIAGMTQLIVIRAAAETGAPSYEDMVRLVLGKGWGTVLEVVVLVYQFGACVAYLDVVADQGTSIMCEYAASTFGTLCDGTQFLLRAVLVAAIAFGFCLPFSIPRRIDTLAKISMIGVLAPCTMSLAIIILGAIDMSNRGVDQVFYMLKWVPDANTGVQDVLKSIPIILFALQSHIVVPSVYTEMKPTIKTPKNLAKGMVFAYLMVASCYTLTGIFGYTQFGNDVNGDLLKTNTVLSASRGPALRIVINCARGLIALGALCSFPLNHFPGRSALFNLVTKKRTSTAPLPQWVYILEAVGFVGVCYGLAVAVPQISYVFSIMGATCGTGVIFIFPAMIHLAMPKYQRRQRTSSGDTFGDDDTDLPETPEVGGMVDVASGRHGRKVEDADDKHVKAKAQRRAKCVRIAFSVAVLVMGAFVIVTGTQAAVSDLITNLIDK